MSFINNEWETLTASISLTIAITSGWIAYESFYRQSLSEKPQIVLRLDFRSRYDLILLVAENLGSKSAFNISLIWDKPLLNYNGEKVSFNNDDTGIEIPILNPKESTSLIIGEQSSFFGKYKDDNLNYRGKILFQESLYSKRKTSNPFYFSFKHYAKSPSFESEEPRAMFELQKLPMKLNEIKEAIKTISENVKNKHCP
ncbi:MAG: hypothetical protein IH597_06560 [Bacteroidales bacterium]|nr:hypothetical protein [Bacteroidales bacterium]